MISRAHSSLSERKAPPRCPTLPSPFVARHIGGALCKRYAPDSLACSFDRRTQSSTRGSRSGNTLRQWPISTHCRLSRFLSQLMFRNGEPAPPSLPLSARASHSAFYSQASREKRERLEDQARQRVPPSNPRHCFLTRSIFTHRHVSREGSARRQPRLLREWK